MAAAIQITGLNGRGLNLRSGRIESLPLIAIRLASIQWELCSNITALRRNWLCLTYRRAGCVASPGSRIPLSPERWRRPLPCGASEGVAQQVDCFRLADEITYIQDKAADRDGRIVTIGQLILFSTDTVDAWLLDVTGQLAARLARDGDPEPIYPEETETSFAIEWQGHYRIEGSAFVYADSAIGSVTNILGYPTQKIAQANG